MTAVFQVKVVIIGQDPYHGPKQAHGTYSIMHISDYLYLHTIIGLCFSVRVGVQIPPRYGWHVFIITCSLLSQYTLSSV